MNTNNSENTEFQEAVEVDNTQPTGNPNPAKEEHRNVLLGTISYTNDADYEAFLSKMDINQSLFVLIASANYSQAKGLFNLDESELIARAIKTIKKNSAPAKPADGSTNE